MERARIAGRQRCSNSFQNSVGCVLGGARTWGGGGKRWGALAGGWLRRRRGLWWAGAFVGRAHAGARYPGRDPTAQRRVSARRGRDRRAESHPAPLGPVRRAQALRPFLLQPMAAQRPLVAPVRGGDGGAKGRLPLERGGAVVHRLQRV